MPLAEVPPAPGQGALAICCRKDAADLIALLEGALHDGPTAASVTRERAILRAHGGGCHQRFGVVHVPHAHLADGLTLVTGEDTGGTALAHVEGATTTLPGPVWDGRDWRAQTARTVALAAPPLQADALFVAHHRGWVEGSHARHLWTSGTMSWRKLAERGLWVEGCADGLGFEHIRPTLTEPVLGLPPLADWQVATHADALGGWSGMAARATYGLEVAVSPRAREALRTARSAYWASAAQFRALREDAPAGLIHACGPGKTYLELVEAGIAPVIALLGRDGGEAADRPEFEEANRQ
jgi:hydroxymethylbilane synthase